MNPSNLDQPADAARITLPGSGDRLLWQSSTYETFTAHQVFCRLKRLDTFFLAILGVWLFYPLSYPMEIQLLALAAIASLIYMLPRMESAQNPWQTYAISNRGIHTQNKAGHQDDIFWTDKPDVKISQSWFAQFFGGPTRVQIKATAGQTKPHTVKWSLSTQAADVMHKLVQKKQKGAR